MNITCVNLYINGKRVDSQSAAMYRTEIERSEVIISSTVRFKSSKTIYSMWRGEEKDQIKLKSKYIRVRFNRKDRMTLYNLYTSKVRTKFEIQLPIVIHRVVECQGDNA